MVKLITTKVKIMVELINYSGPYSRRKCRCVRLVHTRTNCIRHAATRSRLGKRLCPPRVRNLKSSSLLHNNTMLPNYMPF